MALELSADALKTLLAEGNYAALDATAPTAPDDVKALAKAATGSARRVRTAAGVLAVHASVAGDTKLRQWLGSQNLKAVLQGLLDRVDEHPSVDRLEGEVRVQLGANPTVWSECNEVLLRMRTESSLAAVLDAAEAKDHRSPGLVNLLARGGDLKRAADRVRAYLAPFEGTEHFTGATRDWILAKLDDADAHQRLLTRVREGDAEQTETLRAAQALCHLRGWPFVWDPTTVADVRRRLGAAT